MAKQTIQTIAPVKRTFANRTIAQAFKGPEAQACIMVKVKGSDPIELSEDMIAHTIATVVRTLDPKGLDMTIGASLESALYDGTALDVPGYRKRASTIEASDDREACLLAIRAIESWIATLYRATVRDLNRTTSANGTVSRFANAGKLDDKRAIRLAMLAIERGLTLNRAETNGKRIQDARDALIARLGN